MKNTFITTLVFITVLFGCKKNSTDQIIDLNIDRLTVSQDSLFTLLKDTVFSTKDIILPDGGSVRDFLLNYDSIFYHQWNRVGQISTAIEVQKSLFISRITNIANHMVIKSNYTYPDEGPMRPAQTGLAYVWGGRIFEQRIQNKDCTDYLHGVDCSGLLIRVLRYAGLNISDGKIANTLKEVDYLNELFIQSSEFTDLTYEDKGSSVALTQLQTGDIIYFNKGNTATHIGIALRDINGKLWIYQSNGTYEAPKCNNNINKGPRCVESTNFLSPVWGFTSYGVLRIPSPASSAVVDAGGNVYYSIISPTGKIWLDRNLGATRVATSSTDFFAYGNIYQWGRDSDGHQLITWTGSKEGFPVNGTTTNQSASNTPGHSLFIIGNSDWRNPENNNLWQGINGINNQCPAGYRLPTPDELDAERKLFPTNNTAGAFGSVLKLPAAGYRFYADGVLQNAGSDGNYASNTGYTINGSFHRILFFHSSNSGLFDINKASGVCIRCIKD